MIRLGLPLLLAASLLPGAAHAADLPDPLGLRGFNLGVTLDELRRQKFPDPTTDDVRLICSGDELSGQADLSIPPGSLFREVGAKICRFHAVASGKVRTAFLNVGGHDARVLFFITPKSDDLGASERLYQIMVDIKREHFDDVAKAYTARFGEPDQRNGRSPRLLLWENSRVSLIVTEKPSEFWRVLYVNRKQRESIDTLMKSRATPGADKL